jgi:hypothetical protein
MVPQAGAVCPPAQSGAVTPPTMMAPRPGAPRTGNKSGPGTGGVDPDGCGSDSRFHCLNSKKWVLLAAGEGEPRPSAARSAPSTPTSPHGRQNEQRLHGRAVSVMERKVATQFSR